MTGNHSMLNQGLAKLVTPDGAAPAWKPLEIAFQGIFDQAIDLLFLTTYCPMAAWLGLWYQGPFDTPYSGSKEWRWEWPGDIQGNFAGNGLFTAAVDPLVDPRQPCRCVTLTNKLEVYGFYSRASLTNHGISNNAALIVANPWVSFMAPGAGCRIDQHTSYDDGASVFSHIPCFIPESEYTAGMLAADNIAVGTWGGQPVTLQIAGLYKVVVA